MREQPARFSCGPLAPGRWQSSIPRMRLASSKAVSLLAAALNSKEPRVRHAAVHGLIDLDSKSERIFPAIKQALACGRQGESGLRPGGVGVVGSAGGAGIDRRP